MKKVIITFIYETKKGKDNEYYRQKAFDEIYNRDDNLDSSNWEVTSTQIKQEVKHKDRKWSIRINEEGYFVYVKCNCGLKHDIQLDKVGKFVGRGTQINETQKA